MNTIRNLVSILAALFFSMHMVSCSKENSNPVKGPDSTGSTKPVIPAFDIDKINDTYADVSAFDLYPLWGPYNVHDPSIYNNGDYYYCYSTDVGFGIDVP